MGCFRSVLSHASIPVEERNRIGITDNLVRLSVGLEDVDDIIADLDQALHSAVSVFFYLLMKHAPLPMVILHAIGIQLD